MEVICQQHPEILATSHLKWSDAQWKRVLWSDESAYQVVYRNNGHSVLQAKEEKDHLDCCQRKAQKPESVMVIGSING